MAENRWVSVLCVGIGLFESKEWHGMATVGYKQMKQDLWVVYHPSELDWLLLGSYCFGRL